MNWWLKVRLIHTAWACGITAFTMSTLVFQDGAIELPAISINAGNTVLLVTFTPLFVVAVLARCLGARLPSAEMTGVRPIGWMDTVLIATTMFFVMVVTLCGGLLLSSTSVYIAGRNAIFLSGVMLCARPFIGRSSIMLPTTWIFLVIFFGHRTAADYYSWAITGLPIQSWPAASLAGTTLLFGIILNQLLAKDAS